MLMTLSILTYNVLYNKGYEQLDKLLIALQPDILNLQEVDTTEKNLSKLEKLGYSLADYSNSFIEIGHIYGVATYYKKNALKLIDTKSISLYKSTYEFITNIIKIIKGKHQSRTILKTNFEVNGTKISIFNAHLSVFGTNGLRIKQLRQALDNYNFKTINPLIFTGDFNYPYGRKKLEKLMNSYNLKEATKNIDYTFVTDKKADYNLFQILLSFLVKKFYNHRYKLDYIYYKNLKLVKTKRIEVNFSDHFPILSSFQI